VIDWITQSFAYIPDSYKLDFEIILDDPEGYTEAELEKICRSNVLLEMKTFPGSKTGESAGYIALCRGSADDSHQHRCHSAVDRRKQGQGYRTLHPGHSCHRAVLGSSGHLLCRKPQDPPACSKFREAVQRHPFRWKATTRNGNALNKSSLPFDNSKQICYTSIKAKASPSLFKNHKGSQMVTNKQENTPKGNKQGKAGNNQATTRQQR